MFAYDGRIVPLYPIMITKYKHKLIGDIQIILSIFDHGVHIRTNTKIYKDSIGTDYLYINFLCMLSVMVPNLSRSFDSSVITSMIHQADRFYIHEIFCNTVWLGIVVFIQNR